MGVYYVAYIFMDSRSAPLSSKLKKLAEIFQACAALRPFALAEGVRAFFGARGLPSSARLAPRPLAYAQLQPAK
jgi:hypothetical protein